MEDNKVTIFEPYPFTAGQKIRIEGGKRAGDWEVVNVTERKVTLRCPISAKEFEWNRFCYFASDQEDAPWPLK